MIFWKLRDYLLDHRYQRTIKQEQDEKNDSSMFENMGQPQLS